MIFDHTDLSAAWSVIGGLFGVGTVAGGGTLASILCYELTASLPLLLLAAIAATPYPARFAAALRVRYPTAAGVADPILTGLLLVLATAYTVSGGYSPFLYFNF